MADNQGQEFDRNHDDVFIAYLVAEFEGCTQAPSTLIGAWLNAGKVYRDNNRIFLVKVSGMVAASSKLQAAVAFAKQHYQQIEIYLRYLGVSEIL